MRFLASAALAALLVVPLLGEAAHAQATNRSGSFFGARAAAGGGGGGGGGGAAVGGGGRGGGGGGGAFFGARGAGGGGGFRNGGGGGGFRGGDRDRDDGFRGRGFRGRNNFFIGPSYYPGFYDPFWPYGYGYGAGFGFNYDYYPYDYPSYGYVPAGRGPAGYDDYLPPAEQFGPAPAQVWYYCDDPQGYYPYVRNCSHDWQAVPATPPGAQNSSAGPDANEATASLDRPN